MLKKDPDRKLPRRAPRSAECSICPTFISQVYPKACSSADSRQQFERQLTAGSSEQASFDEHLRKWEHNHLGKRRREVASSSEEDVPKARKKLKAKEVDEFVGETCVGVHWPLKILQSHPETKNLQVSRRKKKTWNGVVGVVLPTTSTAEIPDGCTKLYKRQSRVVESSTAVADSSTVVRAAQYSEAHEEARKYVAVTKTSPIHKVHDKDGKPAPVTLTVPVAKQPDDHLGLFSSILPQGGLLECGLSADSGSDRETPTKAKKKSKKEKTDQDKVDQKDKIENKKPSSRKIRIDLGEGYRRLVFQVGRQLCCQNLCCSVPRAY